jgi:hypothetical protein
MLHRPSQPAGRAQEAQAQEVPRPVPPTPSWNLLLSLTFSCFCGGCKLGCFLFHFSLSPCISCQNLFFVAG